MLDLNGTTLLQRMVQCFRDQGIREVTVIRGYLGQMIDLPGLGYVENPRYATNNILHSLMTARAVLEEACRNGDSVVVSYSDILFETALLRQLLESSAPLALMVDTHWEAAYAGRSDHPPAEAENVLLDRDQRVLRIAKNLFDGMPPEGNHGEFIGLWKCTADGAGTLLRHFDRIDRLLGPDDPFQKALRWHSAYLTDLFQEMIDRGEAIDAVPVAGGWMEIDTEQDYRRALARENGNTNTGPAE